MKLKESEATYSNDKYRNILQKQNKLLLIREKNSVENKILSLKHFIQETKNKPIPIESDENDIQAATLRIIKLQEVLNNLKKQLKTISTNHK